MESHADLKSAIRSTVFLSMSSGKPIVAGNERDLLDWTFDFRALLLQPQWLNRYAELFWQRYAAEYPFQVSGMETAAISVVAAIVMKGVERGTPVNGVYIRKSRKRAGLLKQIEGTLNAEKVILVDDLINTGSTFQKQIKVLTDAGVRVSDIFAVVAFREKPAYDYLNARVETIFRLEDFGLPMVEQAAQEPSADPFEIIWRFKSPNPLRNFVHEKSGPVLDETRVYFGTDRGDFVALDQTTGAVVWEFKTGNGTSFESIFSTALLYKDTLYFGSNNGVFYALDKTTGTLRWQYTDADRINSTPAIAPKLNLVFTGLEFGLFKKQGRIVALNADTGAKVWSADLPGDTRSSPLYIPEENMVVIGDDVGNICGYSADTGAVRFHHRALSGVFGGFAYDQRRRVIYFGSMDGACCGLFAPSGEVVFVRQPIFGIYSTPIIHDDMLYFSSLDKRIYAIDVQTGKDKWQFATKGRIFASPAVIEGSLWIGSNDGKLYELDPQTGRLRSSFQASERIVNSIAYNPQTKRFFMPTQANELYCLVRKNSKK